MSKRDVFVGYCHPGVVDGAFHDCIVNMLQVNPRIASVCSAEAGPWLPGVRNLLADQFMSTDLEWYLQLDADMVFNPDLPDKLIACYNDVSVENSIVSGLYFGYIGRVRHAWPQLYDIDGKPVYGYQPNTLNPSFSTGGGAVMIHRSHLEKLGKPYFVCNETGKDQDQIFFQRLREDHGVQLYVHSGIQLGHRKTIIAGEGDFIASQQAQANARSGG